MRNLVEILKLDFGSKVPSSLALARISPKGHNKTMANIKNLFIIVHYLKINVKIL
jgi:hypothetical protein